MKIFISDLHLGDGSKTDDFHRDKELINLLEKYQDEQIILLGDICELWQSRLDRIMWAHADVIHAITRRTQCIYGNHDYLPFAKYWSEKYEDSGIYAVHGHQYDVFNRYKNPLFALKWPIGKYIALLIGELERWWCKDADVWLEKQSEKYGEFLTQAAELQNMEPNKGLWPIPEKNQILITGHTHKAGLHYVRVGSNSKLDRIYANCGAWVDDVRPTYIEVDDTHVRLKDGLTFDTITELKIHKGE
jgi:UDP-2,3-diacylglucosamine pyrophosphatase LpxH